VGATLNYWGFSILNLGDEITAFKTFIVTRITVDSFYFILKKRLSFFLRKSAFSILLVIKVSIQLGI
jgi:hypothetical protein